MKRKIFIFSFLCFVLMLIPNKVWASTMLNSVTLSEGFVYITESQDTYNVTIYKENTFSIIEANVSNATVTYSPSQTIDISYGETKSIIMTVTDNTSKESKNYTINVYKLDNRSTVNTLKGLTVSNTDIKFNGTTSYSSTVKNEINQVEITAISTEEKVLLTGIGKKDLKVGLNSFEIIVSAKNNKKKVYKIDITREANKNNETTKPIEEEKKLELSNNNYLKNLTIEEIKDFKFNKEVLTYKLAVDNNIEELNINYQAEDEKAIITTEGETKLLIGKNKITISVTAENKEVKKYVLEITRKEKEEELDAQTKEILDALDKEDQVITIKVKLNSNNTNVNKKIIEKLMETKKTLIYEINNSADGLLYSASFNGKNITNEITSLNYGLKFTSDNEEKIKKLTNGYSILDLNFAHSGILPKDTTFKVYVGNRYTNGKVVYLYKYNKEKNKLELMSNDIKANDGYVDVKIDHCSEYILSNEKISESKNAIIVISLITFLILIILGLVYAIMRKKKKANNKDFGIEVTDDINVFNPLVDNIVKDETPVEEEIEIVDAN